MMDSKPKSNFDPYGLPEEIYLPTLPLVGVAGLNSEEKKSHMSVWETFTMNRRSDRIPMKFVLLPSKPEFPSMKQKRQSYEWYIPKGTLKSNWVDKYISRIPSLLVLFWDLDWSDPNWAEEKNKIAAQFQSIKLALGGRNTRVAVVLIQSNSGNPGEDGSGASEKAASLCSACDLAPKHLFVLPHADSHLLGYTIRLENAFSEIAGGFYLGEIKRVKLHQNFLNKTNHQLLFIRHQFKVAFYNEMRSDLQSAIKHYNQSYNFLLEHRFTNTNLHEIRIVAAIINYKICKLNFSLNLPRDAIEQFRKHIEVFRQRTGPKELIFEHYAWLSKQYQVFGEIFEEAVNAGLPAVQTQHPGFYYQQAAHYAVIRKNTAVQVCKGSLKPESDLLSGWESLEFYGQRPWRPGKHSLEPPEMNTEAEGIKAVCYYESNKVNHSELIIPEFSSAITQFKKYRCPRIKRYLMNQMAKEYLEAKDPAKALALLNHVMWDYRSERWWSLLSAGSSLALSCAYRLASVQEYLAVSLEILGPRIITSDEEKKSALDNYKKLINYDIPSPPFDLNADDLSSASELWCLNLNPSRPPITINMNEILPCFEVRAGFVESESHVDKPAQVSVKIRNHVNEALKCFSLTVLTSQMSGQPLIESDTSKLILPASGILCVPLVFRPTVSDVDKAIKITGVSIGVGSCREMSMTLHWMGVGSEGVTVHTGSSPALKEFGIGGANPMEEPRLHSQLNITSREPQLRAKLTYDASALVWEWLPVPVELFNDESSAASDICVSLCLEPGSENGIERTTQVSLPSNLDNKLSSSSVQNHPLPTINPGKSFQFLFYIKTLTATKRSFRLKITYKCSVESNGSSLQYPTQYIYTFSITSKIPFQISIETQSMGFSPLSKLAQKERFVAVPKIKCFAHVPLELINSTVAVSQSVIWEGEKASQVSGIVINDGEEATDCFCLAIGHEAAPINSPISLGQYLLYWKRSGVDVPTVSVSIGLPTITIENWGVWVEVDIPPQGTVRIPLSIVYKITNTSQSVQELAVSMHASDAFMFSGPKESRLRILAGWHESVTFNLYPLLAGYVQLPRLNIVIEGSSNNNSAQSASLNEFIQRILPSHLFVMPQEKRNQAIQIQDNTIGVR